MDQTTTILILLTVFGFAGLGVMLLLLYPRMQAETKEREAIRQDWQELNDRLLLTEARLRSEMDLAQKAIANERNRANNLEYRLERLGDENVKLQGEVKKLVTESGRDKKKISALEDDKETLTARVRKLERILKDRGLDTGPLDQGVT